MSYSVAARMSIDSDLRVRIAACAATQPITVQPLFWADQHQWKIAGSPGWDEAYSYAVLTGNERPGDDPAVITDGMILAAVQPLVTAETPG